MEDIMKRFVVVFILILSWLTPCLAANTLTRVGNSNMYVYTSDGSANDINFATTFFPAGAKIIYIAMRSPAAAAVAVVREGSDSGSPIFDVLDSDGSGKVLYYDAQLFHPYIVGNGAVTSGTKLYFLTTRRKSIGDN
jgi:hypothetical protein